VLSCYFIKLSVIIYNNLEKQWKGHIVEAFYEAIIPEAIKRRLFLSVIDLRLLQGIVCVL